MDKVTKIEEEHKETLTNLKAVADEKKDFILEIRQKVMDLMIAKLGKLQENLQEYFMIRHGSLERDMNNIHTVLSESMDVHRKIFAFRGGMMDILNGVTKPPVTVEDGDLLCNNVGEADAKKVYEKTEECLSQSNEIQEQYIRLVTEILESLPSMIEGKLQALEIKVIEQNLQMQKVTDAKSKKIEDALGSARKILEAMTNMKLQMEQVFASLYKRKVNDDEAGTSH